MSASVSRIVWRLLPALIAGCGGPPQMNYDAIDLIQAHGRVTLDGRPLPNAVVTFESPDGQFSYGITDRDGGYVLYFDSVKRGVTPGTKTVRISTARKILGLNANEEAESEGGEEAAGPDGGRAAPPSPPEEPEELVPRKYNANSELTVDVTPGRTEYNFDLTSS